MVASFDFHTDYRQNAQDPMLFERVVPWHQPHGVVEFLGGGNTCMVGRLQDGDVLKYPLVPGEHREELEGEREMYLALGQHERILAFRRLSERGLVVEHAAGGSLTDRLLLANPIDNNTRLKWAQQCAQGVAYIHSKGVIHCDIHPNNTLLDANDDIKLCDFQGVYQEWDGGALESTRYCLPRPLDQPPNERSDIFALGSTLYMIMTGRHPYQELPNDEVEDEFRNDSFPDTSTLLAGAQILKCWRGAYASATELVSELMDVETES